MKNNYYGGGDLFWINSNQTDFQVEQIGREEQNVLLIEFEFTIEL